MDDALARVVVAELRHRGFTGSLPHLRRRLPDRIDLLSVQHHSASGSFVVEVAVCPAGGTTTAWGAEVPPTKVTAQDIGSPRPRLGTDDFPASGDHWFVYGPRSYEPRAGRIRPQEEYDAVAAEVLALVDSQAEPFWATQPPG